MTTYNLIPIEKDSDDEHICFHIKNAVELAGTFFVTRGNNGLSLYNEENWESLRQRVYGGDLKDDKIKSFIRQYIAPAVKVQIDRGVLLLPRGLLMFDNLSENEVQLVHRE